MDADDARRETGRIISRQRTSAPRLAGTAAKNGGQTIIQRQLNGILYSSAWILRRL